MLSDGSRKAVLKEKASDRRQRLFDYDRQYWDAGTSLLAGMDEAGRGPLAGPVVAACVILPPDVRIDGVDDSKKLSEKKRASLFTEIKNTAIAYSIGIVEHDIIDGINILNASRLAFKKAYDSMAIKPQTVLTDHIDKLDIDCGYTPLVKGDATSYSIASASILAKVYRDTLMADMDEKYPLYGFAKNKGYGTLEHYEALRKYGPCPIHRMSFLKNLNQHGNTGAYAENIATEFFKSNGYGILRKNYATKLGEVDIIASKGETIVFAEVKARSSVARGIPSEAVDKNKQKKISYAAMEYIQEHGNQKNTYRFDVFEVYLQEKKYRHIENAFVPDDKFFI